jgi:hypothetical protein
MAVAGFDRIRQTSTSTGTGNISLVSVTGFRTFTSEFSPGELIPYVIEGRTGGGVYDNQWEVGIGTLSGGVLVRSQVTNSASGVGTAHSFTSASLVVVAGFTQGGVELLIRNSALTVSNKTFSDSTTTFADNSDPTKTMKFQLSGISTGTERTLTVPNSNGTIALLSDIPVVTPLEWGNITGTLSAQTDLNSALNAKVSLTGVETLTNKTLVDDNTTFQDNVDPTKLMRFQLSGIGTGQTRTVTLPNKSGTMAMLDDISGSAAIWGNITGTLADQTDLQTALNLKANASDLTTHTGLTSAHGTSSAIVGIDDAQTLTNKTLLDSTTLIADDVDPTKRARFEASNLGAGVTRVYTMPDKNGTLAMLDDIVGGGGGAAWGTITGAISSQTDLWAYLNVMADLTTAQTLTNKSLVDASTFLIDDGDATKRAQFQLSGITTATTRTITLPNKSGTMAMLDDIVGGSAPPFTKGMVVSVGSSEVWVNPLHNDDGDIVTANLTVLHENTVASSESQHNLQTITDGLHSVVSFIYANATARQSGTFAAYDVGKIAWQQSNNTYWILSNHSPMTWHELSNSELIDSLVHYETVDGTATPNVDDFTDIAFNEPTCRVLRFTPTNAEFNLRGLAITADGRLIHFQNTSTTLGFFVLHEDTNSIAQNRFNFPGGVNYYVPPRSGFSVVYDGAISRWRPVGGQAMPLLLNSGLSQTPNTVTIGNSLKFNYTQSSMYDVLIEWEGHNPTNVTATSNAFTQALVGSGVINSASYPITDTINNGQNQAITIRSSATANTGARIFTENLQIVLGVNDGEGNISGIDYIFECRFMMNDTVTGRVLRMGWHDASTATDAVDGAYIEISSQSAKGKTAANSSRSTTATTFTYSSLTWYIAKISHDGQGSVYFTISLEDGTVMWEEYLSFYEAHQFPQGIARAMGVSFIATNTSAAAANICAISYIAHGTSASWTKKLNG